MTRVPDREITMKSQANILRYLASFALLGGLIHSGAQAAPPPPRFGAFANVDGAVDGGLGKFSASKSIVVDSRGTGKVAAAVANLATGSLHASSFLRTDCTRNCGRVGTSSTARFLDRLVFSNSGDNISLVPVTLRVDGTCRGNGATSARYRFGFTEHLANADTFPWRNIACGESVDIAAPVNLLSFSGDTGYFAYFELQTTATIFDDGGFALADFGHTMKVDIRLPENITMSSASGQFPAAAPVPEPEVWALMLGGFGLAGSAMRRRNRSRQIVSA